MEVKKWYWVMMTYSVIAVEGYLTWKGGGKIVSYPISSVQGVQYESGLTSAIFRFIISGEENHELVIAKNENCQIRVDEINMYIAEYKKTNTSVPTFQEKMAQLVGPFIAAEMTKLQELVDKGLLSQEQCHKQTANLFKLKFY